MKRIALIAGALPAIGAIRGCSSTQQVKAGNPAATGDRVSLVGTQRVLRDLAGSPALEKPQATLGFPGAGHAAGNGSCNQCNGTVSISGVSIKFGPLAATRMACMENGIGDQEDRYLKTLGARTRYELRGEKLLIYFEGSDKAPAFSRAAGGNS